jgi:PhzF family phenazine biosynthesis protein
MHEVLRYAAFTDRPDGGNPAGVVLDASGLDDAAMQTIAAEVGYSETAFLTERTGGVLAVRYFTPKTEVSFCGHATIALSVAVAGRRGVGSLALDTKAGRVDVLTRDSPTGVQATLTSVETYVDPVADADVAETLSALGWVAAELDETLPPRVGYAGERHLILGVSSRERLAELDYDYERLRAVMQSRDWITVALVHRRDATTFDTRNPAPAIGILEDPATGAAAAAFGAYLRELGLIDPPAQLTLYQGDDLGRPSVLRVEVPTGADSGVRVTGRAVVIP